ncbi:MAG: amidase family protein [Azospirillaceae bacterium]
MSASANEAPCLLSIAEIGRLYRRRELSPVDVVAACLQRIERLNPQVNAFVTVTADSAMAAARRAERRFASGEPDRLNPLFGIPFTVKDTLPTAGVRTTSGSPLFADAVPAADAAAVERLLQRGAILLGKTNTPAFGWMGVTQNLLFGVTRNPWNPELTCGGSSGGAAVATLCGMAPLNIGTDGGGSLRIPASFCGILGFKPSFGRVPNHPGGPNWSLQHVGPMARSVADLSVAYQELAGPDERDPYSLPAEPPRPEADGEPPLRVLFCDDLGFAEAVDPEVVEICRRATARLSEAGHDVATGRPGWPSPMRFWQTLFTAGLARRLGPSASERPDAFEPELLGYVKAGERLGPFDFYDAGLARIEWWQHVRATFEQADVLEMQAVACPPFAAGRRTVGTIAGREISFYGWSPFSAPFNLTGQPAISIPAGQTRSGLPVGLQLVGSRFADRQLLRLAATLELLNPWPTEPPAFG